MNQAFSRLEVVIPEDTLGEIDRVYYSEMLDALIAEHFGGQYTCSFSFASRLGNRWSLDCEDSRREEVVAQLDRLAEDAFNRCCRSEAVREI